jgi:hypothetical protein
MATTTAFGWSTPDDTSLVKDGAAAIRTLGQSIDTSMSELKGGTTGQVLSKTSNTDMDFTWIEQDDSTLSFNAQTGTTYTLVAGDAINTLVTSSNASPITVTVPPSIFATGNVINLQQIGVGQVTFAQGAGVTITSTGATSTAPKLRARYSACSIICTAANTFTIIGDLV